MTLKGKRLKLWLAEAALAILLFVFLAIGSVSIFVTYYENLFNLRSILLAAGLFIGAGLCIYGIWRIDKKAKGISEEIYERTGKVTKLWYLAPVLMGFIGGIWGWYCVRKKDPKMAKWLLILGIIFSVVWYFVKGLL
jgi:uncharacterized membrane protein YfcA